MDWARAIEINQTALTRIVAGLIAVVELAGGGMAERLSRPVYRAVMLVLRPAESAVRRLIIIIAARGVVVKPSPARPMPKGLAPAGKRGGAARVSFQLFDSRKRFERRRRKYCRGPGPRIRIIDFSPLVPVFQPPPQNSVEPAPEPDSTVSAARLGRRLLAIKDALENLPQQAKRLVRWKARREKMTSPKFRDPLRPGRPPGYRKRPRHEVDAVLSECHSLAWYALHPNTS
jgi:hypothetical protein